MFRRFHEMKERGESGFTLIELLVVILIIAILAAIAIPVFLAQRKKGWGAQAQSAVKNMATAEESYATSNNGVYAETLAKLTAEGFKYSSTDVTPSVITPTTTTDEAGYCLKAVSAHDSTIVWYYRSSVGAPQTAACTGP
ncbi:N/A [soil metagenome]